MEPDQLDKIGILVAKKVFYPKTKTLINSEGKSVELTIIGRDDKHFFYVKDNDESKYSIDKLSKVDMEAVKKFPLTSYTKALKNSEETPTEVQDETPRSTLFRNPDSKIKQASEIGLQKIGPVGTNRNTCDCGECEDCKRGYKEVK